MDTKTGLGIDRMLTECEFKWQLITGYILSTLIDQQSLKK